MSTTALSYQGRSYKSPTALYHANEHSPLVSVDRFRNRIWADRKNNRLSDERIEDALNLSANEYNHKYGRRTTWIKVAGERRSQMEVYEGLSARLNGSVVPYMTFYQRALQLRSRLNHFSEQFSELATLNDDLLAQAATCDNASWRRGWGAARVAPQVHEGVLYPTVKSLLFALGREGDYPIIKARLKRGVPLEVALVIEKQEKGGLVYLLKERRTGRGYVGVTSQGLEARWQQHLSDARKGSTTLLHEAIREAGPNGFTREVLADEIESTEELKAAEKQFIKELKTVDYGLNANGGGSIGGGVSTKCYWDGEEYPSLKARNETLAERYNQKPHIINRLIEGGLPLDTPVRSEWREHLGNPDWQRQWKKLIRMDERGELELHTEWMSAEAWMRDIAPDKHEGEHLVHIDKTKPFAPGNVQWMTVAEERAHQSGISIPCFGRIYPTKQALADAYGIGYSTLKYRLACGMTPEEAVSKELGPTSGKRQIVSGKTFPSLFAVSVEYGINYGTLKSRVESGMLLEDAVSIEAGSIPQSGTKVDCYGKTFPGVSALGRHYGVPISTLDARLARGMTPEEAVLSSPAQQSE